MLWIVGPVAKDYQSYFETHNIPYGQFAHPGTAHRGAEVIELDFTSADTLRHCLTTLPGRPDVTAVLVTGFETYVVSAAILAAYFGVPGMSPEAAVAATDKLQMRRKFQMYSHTISPDFIEVVDWEQLSEFYITQNSPVMLKPANLMKSLFVTKNNTIQELRFHYNQLQRELPPYAKKHRIGRTHIIAETFMAGTMHTVAGFVDDKGELTVVSHAADCTTANDIGKADNSLYERRLPTVLGTVEESELFTTARRGTQALGLKNTPVHIELIRTVEGTKIVEIGARLGGYRPRMYSQAYGIDLYAAAIRCAFGEPVELIASKSLASSVIELFPDRAGEFISVTNISDAQSLPSIVSCRVKVRPGQQTGAAANGFKAAAVINLCGSMQQVIQDEAYIRQNVTVRTRN